MSSEIVVAEIVETLPVHQRTESNIAWVQENLQDNSIQDVLSACKEYFGATSAKLATCERNISAMGIRLDQHIQYVDAKFQAVNTELYALKERVAVQEAIGSERAQMNQFMFKGVMDAQNLTNQAVVTAAKSTNGGGGFNPFLPLAMCFGVIVLCIAVSLAEKVNKPKAQQCGIDVSCDVRPLNNKGGV